MVIKFEQARLFKELEKTHAPTKCIAILETGKFTQRGVFTGPCGDCIVKDPTRVYRYLGMFAPPKSACWVGVHLRNAQHVYGVQTRNRHDTQTAR